MNEKYQQLSELIGKAFFEPEFKSDPKIQNTITTAATQLHNHEDYTKIAVELSLGITNLYLTQHKVATILKTIYDFVADGADATKLDLQTRRNLGILSGYVRSPLNSDKIW